MDGWSEVSEFYKAIAGDPRISATHISLYMALFQLFRLSGFKNPIRFTRGELMPMAKISSSATYHKCLRDLAGSGYIVYIPSCNPFLKSLVYIH